MKQIALVGWLVCAIAAAGIVSVHAQQKAGRVVHGAGEQLMALANQARVEAGVGKLQWDDSLAAAARDHCLRMAAEGPIAHRYGGEDSLSTRAGKAGALFDLIEENVAVGPTPLEIHEAWMKSPGHRMNLLNADVNRVGIAVVAVRGVLYATADYARGVETLTPAQVEARVGNLVRVSGLTIVASNALARRVCAEDRGLPAVPNGAQPGFLMRWQDSDLDRLPAALTAKLSSGQYRRAAIGSCPAKDVEGKFTVYRVAVLLY